MIPLKRERTEIMKDILGVIMLNRSITTNQLLYKANISPEMFKNYISDLIDKKLITSTYSPGKKNLNGKEKTRGRQIFNLTEKGRQFLEEYKLVEMFLEKYDLKEEE